jgi:hypothetical protein
MNRFEKISLSANLVDGGGKVVGDALKIWTDPAFVLITTSSLPGSTGVTPRIDFSTFYQIITGSNIVISHDDNIIDGDLWVAKNLRTGVQISGRDNAMIRSVGYEGFMSASLQKSPPGFLLFSGSVLPKYFTPVGTDKRTNYSGVGLEMHAGNGSGSFRFRADDTGSFIEIIAKEFFFGDSNTAYISGSGGILVISSSNFLLSSSGDVFVSGTINATSGAIGNWTIHGDRLESVSHSIQLIGGNTVSGSEIIVRELPSLIPRIYVGITPSSMTGSDGWRDISKYISDELIVNNSFESIPNEISWSFVNANQINPSYSTKPLSYVFAPYRITKLITAVPIGGTGELPFFGTRGAGLFFKSGSSTDRERWVNVYSFVNNRRVTALYYGGSVSSVENYSVVGIDGTDNIGSNAVQMVRMFTFSTPVAIEPITNNGLTNTSITALFADLSSSYGVRNWILAGTSGSGIFFHSGSFNTSWAGPSSTPAYGVGIENRMVTCFAFDGEKSLNTTWRTNDNIFAGTDQGVFVSSNTGSTWTEINPATLPGSTYINDIIFYGARRTATTSATSGNIVVATKDSGIYYCANWSAGFPIWQPANNYGPTGLPSGVEVTSLYTDGTKIWATTFGSGAYTSSDTGSTWHSVGPVNELLTDFITASNNIWYVGTYNKGILKSTNNGVTWVGCNADLSSSIISYGNSTNSLAIDYFSSTPTEVTASYTYLTPSVGVYQFSTNALVQSTVALPNDSATVRIYQNSSLVATASAVLSVSDTNNGTMLTSNWNTISIDFALTSSNPLKVVVAASPRQYNRILFDDFHLKKHEYFTDLSHNGLFVYNSPSSYIQLGRGLGNLVGTIVQAGSLSVNNDATIVNTLWANGGVALPAGAGLSSMKWLYTQGGSTPDYYSLYLGSATDTTRGGSLSGRRYGNFNAADALGPYFVITGSDPNADLFYYWRIGTAYKTRGWVFADSTGGTSAHIPQVEINNQGNILLNKSLTKYTNTSLLKIWDDYLYSGSAGNNMNIVQKAFISYNWFGDEFYISKVHFSNVYDRLYNTSSLSSATSVGADGIKFYVQTSLYPNQTGPHYIGGFLSSGKFNYTDGTQAAGYVLTSDANGNASWTAGGAATNYWTQSANEVHYAGPVNIWGPLSVTGSTVISGSLLVTQSLFVYGIQLGNSANFNNLYVNKFGEPATADVDFLGTFAVTGSSNISGSLSVNNLPNGITIKAGNISTGTTYNQLLFGFETTDNYRHAIKTRHNSANTFGNAFDFYLWKVGTDASTDVGTLPAMTIEGISTNSASARINWPIVYGNTPPPYNFMVNGTSYFSGAIAINDGTQGANKVLTSDANGSATWQTVSGGSSSGSFAITIDTPMATENVTITKTNAAITARGIHYIIRGTLPCSITASIKYGTTRDAAGTNLVNWPHTVCSNTSSGATVTSLDNSSIPANSYIWLVTTGTLGGAPSELNATIYYW